MIEGSLTTLLSYANRASNFKLTRLLFKEKITPGQLIMLEVINNHPRLNLAKLTATLYMERTTISRNLRLLLLYGWIEQFTGPDKRYKQYALTELGTAKLSACKPLFEKFENVLQEEIGTELYRDLNFVISKYLISNAIVKR